MKYAISLWLVIGFSVIGIALAQHAHAGVLCEHRGAAHYSQHGGLKLDSDWHVSQGQLPTCDSNDGGSTQSHQDNTSRDDSWGKDDFGFHCTWHGCG